jgi:prophage regulatory protein
MPHQPISQGTPPPDDEGQRRDGQRLLAMATVMELTTYSRPSIYRLISQGRFPVPLKLGDGKIAFRESEVLEWLESRPRAMSVSDET